MACSAISQLTDVQQSVVNFFSDLNPETDPKTEQLNINEVLGYSAGKIESSHKFIQRLFPIDTESVRNLDAPVLNGADCLILRNNKSVLKGLDAGFERMLKFYGLKWQKDKVVVDVAQQPMQDLRKMSHHDARLTRMIRSLALFGKHVEAKALYDYLMVAVGSSRPLETLDCWRNALNKPIKIPYPNPQPGYETYLFPNKILSEELNGLHPDSGNGQFINNFGDRKKEVFKKQAAAYKTGRPMSCPELPLKASFASNDAIKAYRNKDFLNSTLGVVATCNIETTSELYFEHNASTSKPHSDPSDRYDIHVDFANSAFGGGWRRDKCNAQEEIMFIQNAGLGRIAHHPWLDSNTLAYAISKKNPKYGEAYRTRQEDGTPSPIVIENCELLDEMRKTKDQKDGPRKKASEPKMTNWLAIAACDFREIIVGYRLGQAEIKQRWKNASQADRKAAFIDLFTTAHAGFAMAREIAQKPLQIHSGRLGCGVFMNSWAISAAAQLLAANVIGAKSIKFYHIEDPAEIQVIEKIKIIIADCLEKSGPDRRVGSVFEQVADAIATDANLY